MDDGDRCLCDIQQRALMDASRGSMQGFAKQILPPCPKAPTTCCSQSARDPPLANSDVEAAQKSTNRQSMEDVPCDQALCTISDWFNSRQDQSSHF